MSKVLITGGTGLVGKALSWSLVKAGYQVVHLSRRVRPTSPFPTFVWDPDKDQVDEKAFDGVHHIIHLAGEGVADKRWTSKRKRQIMESRVNSTNLLLSNVKKLGVQLHSYISASAIGIYPDHGAEWMDEESEAGSGFLADVVKEWEASADQFQDICRVAKIRIGVVLSDKGGALLEIAKPVKLYAGAPLGSGKQYVSWIHLNDLVGIFQHVLHNGLEGVFNATAPQPVTNKELTSAIAKSTRKPLFLPNVPAFVMKLVLGQMASVVLEGSRVSSNKIISEGYQFHYTEVQKAVDDLLA